MPIEIKELVIRAIIADNDVTHKMRKDNEEAIAEDNSEEDIDQDEIIAECVDQVLKILRREQGR